MRLREIHVQARDVDAVERFYARDLGLPTERAGAARVLVRVGPSSIVFHAAPGAAAPPCHFAFNVPENQIAEAHAWVAARAEVLSDEHGPIVDFRSWNAHAVYFRDPAGHIVELIARHGLPNASDAPFGPASLLEASEVGVPVPDVAAAVDALRARLGEAPWRPARETFAPVGDEHGLVILVREGRPWFPTDDAAAARPLRIVVEAARPFDGTLAELDVPLVSLATK